MKTCPRCGTQSSDDYEFCIRCGEHFEEATPVSQGTDIVQDAGNPEKLMSEGYDAISSGDFEKALSSWAAAVRNGMQVDDSAYGKMVSGCVDVIVASRDRTTTPNRAGVSDLALLLDDRDLIPDIMGGISAASGDVASQRELMNIANEYMFLAIESFAVYTDMEDLQEICTEADTLFTDMAGRVGSLESTSSKLDPKAFLDNYASFFRLLGTKISAFCDRTSPEDLEFYSEYWASRSGKRFSDIVMGAANMNAQLIGAGWVGSKLATKTRDMQIDALLNMYSSPKR